MSSEIAIRVSNLSKLYHLGEHAAKAPYKTLRDSLSGLFRRRGLRSPVSGPPVSSSDLWALRDVNFEINRGEVVGIIGRNGAGKSTLLKILSRITDPTDGTAEIHGRVGSLLEVGTGFHPELTGRENIFLNGAILGMKRAEISKKFDEIVAFAEVEKFIDTPVKFYSSGMYVRLAFAVAAHLEPEILLVDEVLAVGDASFQKKCLGKMGDVAKQGRTVLFVSHNMTAIAALCQSAIVLNAGQAAPKCEAQLAVAQYSKSFAASIAAHYPIHREDLIIHQFFIEQNNHPMDEFSSSSPITVRCEFELTKSLNLFRIGFYLKTATGDLISRVLLADWNDSHTTLPQGRFRITGQIPANTLVGGQYLIQAHASRYGILDYGLDETISHAISVRAPELFNHAHFGERSYGSVLINPNWELQHL